MFCFAFAPHCFKPHKRRFARALARQRDMTHSQRSQWADMDTAINNKRFFFVWNCSSYLFFIFKFQSLQILFPELYKKETNKQRNKINIILKIVVKNTVFFIDGNYFHYIHILLSHFLHYISLYSMEFACSLFKIDQRNQNWQTRGVSSYFNIISTCCFFYI